MADRILMTPDELDNGATFLETKRDEIVTEVENVKSKIDEICTQWEGAGQQAFVVQFAEMYKVLHENFPEVVTGIASILTQAAEAIRSADQAIADSLKG